MIPCRGSTCRALEGTPTHIHAKVWGRGTPDGPNARSCQHGLHSMRAVGQVACGEDTGRTLGQGVRMQTSKAAPRARREWGEGLAVNGSQSRARPTPPTWTAPARMLQSPAASLTASCHHPLQPTRISDPYKIQPGLFSLRSGTHSGLSHNSLPSVLQLLEAPAASGP